MVKRSGGVPNDVARLKGQRFVAASETEEGKRLAESLIKDLTGQDTVSARFMRAEWFDFKPTHKIWLSTNHKPELCRYPCRVSPERAHALHNRLGYRLCPLKGALVMEERG